MSKPVATNKKAYHNYFLSDKWEAGIALTGGEVKSVRAGEVNFTDSFVRIEKGEAFLYNLHISPYTQASYMNDEPARPRKLLLHKKEIKKIGDALAQKSATLVPTKIYFNQRGIIKVEIAIGKGKKLYDKREAKKKQDVERGLKRALRNRLK